MIKKEMKRENFGPALWPFVDEIIGLRERVAALERAASSHETAQEAQARQAIEQDVPGTDVSVVILPRGEPNIDGEIIEIDGTHRLIYGTGPGYDNKQRTGWFWQQHNIGEFWVTMSDACGMDAHLARLLREANHRLRGKFAPGAAYLADEDGNLRGPVTNQELAERIGAGYYED